jgi:malate dehydrogenase
MKVTVVGAGNVGATCANVIAHKELCNEVVLLDIKEGTAEGKALDIWQTSPINLYDTG